MNRISYHKFILNRRIFTVLLLGFSSGLPLALTGATLQAWFTVSDVDIISIGFLGLIGQPYVYKFLWAPLMDRYMPPLLGRRRGWMLVLQLLLLITIGSMAFFTPKRHTLLIAILSFGIAILSASQDIAIDAYRTDILKESERGLGSAVFVAAFRIAMLVSGGLALVLAADIGWQATLLIMAALMLIGVIASWLGEEPAEDYHTPQTLYFAVVEPFKEFLNRDFALVFLLLIVLYKLGDAFALSLTTTFMIRGLGFSLIDVGAVTKTVGLTAVLVGTFTGGILMTRINLYQALLYFGILQAISNFAFMFLAIVGKTYFGMIITIFIENLCSGMGTVAFLAFLMSLCNRRYTATQFALLSALSAVGRVYVGPFAAYMVKYMGWAHFYFWTVILCLPALMLLCLMKKPFELLHAEPVNAGV